MPERAHTSDLGGVPEVTRFLAKRLIGQAGDRGLSSDAMIAVALSTADGLPEGYECDYPHDLDDLQRCYQAFIHAPHVLRKRMLPILSEWTNQALIEQNERLENE